MLQVPSSRLLALLFRCPHLLLLPPASLEGTWSCLRDSLGLSRQHLAVRVMQQPQLLRMTPEDVRRRMARLASVLGWGEAQVIRLARNQIQLLAASPFSVATKVTALAAMVGVQERVAHDMAQRQPALLSLSSSTVRRNLEGLEAIILLRPGRQRSLLPGESDEGVGGRGSMDRTGGEMTEAPYLPTPVSPKAAWMAEWESVGSLPGPYGGRQCEGVIDGAHYDAPSCQDHPGLVKAVVDQPTLLTISPRTLSKKFEFVSSVLGLRPDMNRWVP